MSNTDKIITVWSLYCKGEDGTFDFHHNHISDGYDPTLTVPTPANDTFVAQKNWKKGKWFAQRAILKNGIVVLSPEPE